MARFFFAAAVWGKLRLRDIPDWGPWNPHRVAYWDEIYLDAVSHLAVTGRKVRTAADLAAALAASREVPGIRTMWIVEDLLDDARRWWEESRERHERRARVRMHTALAAAAVAAFAVGVASSMPNRPAARIPAGPPRHLGAALVASTQQKPGVPGAVQPVAAARAFGAGQARQNPSATVYAVGVGTFASPAIADRIMHLIRSRGYIVNVVPRGAASQVMTSPYRTRTEAERVARGLAQIGFPAYLTTRAL